MSSCLLVQQSPETSRTCCWKFNTDYSVHGLLFRWTPHSSALETRAMGKYTTQTHHDSAAHHITTGQPLSGQQLVRFDSSDFRKVRGHLYKPGHEVAYIYIYVCMCVLCFDGSQEPPSTGKGPSAPEVTLHTSRQNYPQYYIRIDWPVTQRPRNVGCETSGMLCLHMATSALTTNSAVR